MTLSPARLLAAAVDIYVLVIIARAVLSWLPEQYRRNEFGAFLHAITEPILAPIRRLMPHFGGLDLSPVVAVVLLVVAKRLALHYLSG